MKEREASGRERGGRFLLTFLGTDCMQSTELGWSHTHTNTHTHTHTHTRQPRGAVERARQIQSRFLVSGLGKLMNSITGDEMCKGPGTQEALLPFTLHSPARGKASLKSLGHLAAFISDRARSAFTQNCIQLPRAS